MPKKFKNPELQQLKKHERLQYLTKNDFNPETGEYVERQKVNGDSWRLQIKSTHVKDFLWLASRAKRKLSYLKIIRCQVDSWEGIEKLSELRVLDIEHVDLSEGLPAQIAPLKELRALVVTNSHLKALDHIEDFSKLNTLIISKNELTSIPDCVGSFADLEKISFSNNNLTVETIPDLRGCTSLKQARFSHNKELKSLPAHFGRWTKGEGEESKLECLYFASSGLDSDDTLDKLFEHSNSLTELTITNTPLIKDNEELYDERCKAGLPNLKVYNNVRFDEIQKKRAEIEDRRAIKAERKEERKILKERREKLKVEELRLLRDPASVKPKPPPANPEEAAALAAKKAHKRERKKERMQQRIENRKLDRIRAGLPPEEPLPEGVSKFSFKPKLPSKAERKAKKQRKNEERVERRKKRKEQSLRDRARNAELRAAAEGKAQTNGPDTFATNGDFVSFNDAPAPAPAVDAVPVVVKEKKVKRQREEEAAPAVADAPAFVIDTEGERPKKKSKRVKTEAVSEDGEPVVKKKKSKRDKTLDFSDAGTSVTADAAHDALSALSDKAARRKEKKAKSVGGSLAADDQPSASVRSAETGTEAHTSVVGVVDVAKKEKKKKRKAEGASGDVAALLNGTDNMSGVQQW